MSFEASILIAGFILMATIIAASSVIGSRKRMADEEDLKQKASARGWQFEGVSEGGFRVLRYRGTTDGVPWVAESMRDVRGGQSHNRRRPRVARWRTTSAVGIEKPIVCMGVPKGKEIPAAEAGQGWVAQLAQKAVGFAFDKAIDAYFGGELGKEVDAGAMQRVEAGLPGYVVMAANANDASAAMMRGLAGELQAAIGDQKSPLSNEKRPWLLFWKGGVSLARMEQFTDVDEVEAFARAGARLSRATTFGRWSPS